MMMCLLVWSLLFMQPSLACRDTTYTWQRKHVPNHHFKNGFFWKMNFTPTKITVKLGNQPINYKKMVAEDLQGSITHGYHPQLPATSGPGCLESKFLAQLQNFSHKNEPNDQFPNSKTFKKGCYFRKVIGVYFQIGGVIVLQILWIFNCEITTF